MSGRSAYPLRKITGHRRDYRGVLFEVLECGHEQLPVKDIIGETNAYRRRCIRCPKKIK